MELGRIVDKNVATQELKFQLAYKKVKDLGVECSNFVGGPFEKRPRQRNGINEINEIETNEQEMYEKNSDWTHEGVGRLLAH